MRVVICGAGIAGLTLAYCLERRGHEAIVVERAANLRDDGYMIDFFGSGYDAAERLGLIPDLAAIHYPIEKLTFVDARGRERFAIPYVPLRHRLFEDRHFNFLRGELERVLYRRFERRAAIRFGTTVTSFEQVGPKVHVTLADQTNEMVDLLVGADGVHSRIRQLTFGDESQFVRRLGYEMAAFILDEPLPTLPRALFATLTMPGRQVNVYPIRGNRIATFFIHREGPTTAAKSPGTPCERLREVYRDLDWVVPDLLLRCCTAADVFFDAVVQIQLPRWSKGRVACLGDAAWCVSPLAGQGASMAIAGAYVLAEELDRTGDVEDAVARYEGRLKPAIERQQRAGRRIAKWFVPESQFGITVRDVIMRTSVWPGVASVIRYRMAARSILRADESRGS